MFSLKLHVEMTKHPAITAQVIEKQPATCIEIWSEKNNDLPIWTAK